jgi:D-galactarolactone isomerase
MDMDGTGVGRRAFMAGAAALLAAPSGAFAQQVPWSSGTQKAGLRLPADAADCHNHYYDRRFPLAPGAPTPVGDALVSDYRVLQQRLGTSRNVVVQASAYGTDNSCMLEALAAFGRQARGVVMVPPDISDADLRRLHDKGVRGLRFMPQVAWLPNLEALAALAPRVAPMGWCIQVQASADMFVGIRTILDQVTAPIIFEHMASIPNPGGVNHPAFAYIAERLRAKRAWLRISGINYISKVGAPSYSDAGDLVKAFVQLAPDRLIWASAWPHFDKDVKPDDTQLLDLLAEWVPDEAQRRHILVDGPARLFDF